MLLLAFTVIFAAPVGILFSLKYIVHTKTNGTKSVCLASFGLMTFRQTTFCLTTFCLMTF
jgi:hypothetical protein